MRVLVTDADYAMTLSVIRSLGARGADVAALAAHEGALGFASRYCVSRHVGPPPSETDAFVRFVLRTVAEQEIDVVLPVGQDAHFALSQHRDRLADETAIALPPPEAMQVAVSKRTTLDLARNLDVPVPYVYDGAASVDRFPVVAKRVRGSGDVRYLNSPSQLRALEGDDWLLQEYVPGEGRGVFALFDDGVPKVVFQHRRIRELPATGGASSAAMSVREPTSRELALRLLSALRWHGVAMVEFKLDRRDGTYRLMEINPKFWGSLALAIASGVDFPWLTVRLALGQSVAATSDWNDGLRFQWIFRDLVRAATRPRDLPVTLRDLIDPRVANDVSLRDPKPHLLEARSAARALFRAARSASFRDPHGRPVEPTAWEAPQ